MQKTITAMAITAALASVTGHAQAFEGFYAGASLIKAEADFDITVTGTNGQQEQADLDADSVTAAGLFAGYGQRFGQWYLAGELEWRDSMGEASTTLFNGELEAETDSALGLSVIPGYLVTEELLVYTRLAYLEGDTDFTVTNLNNGMSATRSDSGSYTGWGLGTRYQFTEQLSVRAEYRAFDGDSLDYVIDVPFEAEPKDISAFELGVMYQF